MKLYVGNMPFSMDEGQVRELFEAHGTVDSVAIITDRDTGRPRGFGFVEMSDDESSRNAMQALDNHMVEGRNLKVNEAKPRNTGGGGGRGGGGGGGGGGRW
jgi:cold-inducible RNA-binding protein